MNSDPDPDPDLTVDLELLAADTTVSGWRRRAVGMTTQAALAHIPRMILIQSQIPVGPMRTLDAHIKGLGMTRASWLRRAVADQYRREGGQPHIARDITR